MATRRNRKRPQTPPGTSPCALLERATGFYHGSLGEDDRTYAFLREANLTDARLTGVNLTGAYLIGAEGLPASKMA